jgi:hypothetical protein
MERQGLLAHDFGHTFSRTSLIRSLLSRRRIGEEAAFSGFVLFKTKFGAQRDKTKQFILRRNSLSDSIPTSS